MTVSYLDIERYNDGKPGRREAREVSHVGSGPVPAVLWRAIAAVLRAHRPDPGREPRPGGGPRLRAGPAHGGAGEPVAGCRGAGHRLIGGDDRIGQAAWPGAGRAAGRRG